MTRVQTKYLGGAMRFTQDNGKSIDHPASFEYNGREYHFLGGFYYDLPKRLSKHIFKE